MAPKRPNKNTHQNACLVVYFGSIHLAIAKLIRTQIAKNKIIAHIAYDIILFGHPR